MYKVGNKLGDDNIGAGITIYENMIYIFLGFDDVKDAEVENFKKLPVQFRLSRFRNVISILFRFEGLPWNDLCYNPNMSPPIKSTRFAEGDGYKVIMIYHDTNDHTVKAMKFFQLNTWYSNTLVKFIQEEQRNGKLFNPMQYLLNTEQMWYIYSSDDLAKRSSCYCIIRDWVNPEVIMGEDDFENGEL